MIKPIHKLLTPLAVTGLLLPAAPAPSHADLQDVRLLRVLPGHNGAVTALAFGPDGNLVASAGQDELVRLWRPEPDTPARELRHPAGVPAIAFHPDGRLVTLSRDSHLWAWDPAVPRCLGHMPDVAPFRCLALDREGRRVATGAEDGRIRIHDLDRGDLLQVRDADEAPTMSVAFAPDGRRLASAGRLGPITLWELEADASLALAGHVGVVHRVTFTADGEALLTGGVDGTAREWDGRTGEPRHSFTHRGGVRDLAVSPDCRMVATAGEDGVVQLWSRTPVAHLGTLRGHAGAVTAVAFNPTGLRLATGGLDGTVRVWSTDGLLPEAPAPTASASASVTPLPGGPAPTPTVPASASVAPLPGGPAPTAGAEATPAASGTGAP
ncbi:MAG: WD40 repeat domain-containing protein [Candidatus Sericytochromatia bacterium]|nr:WD40 repeat domain-containing protein [Candidatus Sericytochromatia bacterium]